MIRSFIATTALLIAVGTAHAADDMPGPKIEWPDVEGLNRGKPNKFEDKSLGYSVSYVGTGIVVTVFVYDLGRDKIPDGPNSEAIKAEMYQSLLSVEANKTGKKPRYKSLQPLDEMVIPFGSNKTAPQLRRKRYEVEIINEGPSITELYLTGHKNHFIKIRATYTTEGKEKNEKTIADLLDGLGKGLK